MYWSRKKVTFPNRFFWQIVVICLLSIFYLSSCTTNCVCEKPPKETTQELTLANYALHEQAKPFIEEMVKEHNYDKQTLLQLLSKAERQQNILDAISRPAEKTKTWKEYRPIFVNNSRITRGKAYWLLNKKTLKAAEKKYGVPAEIIAAIIGVETNFGYHKGSHKVLDALSTLAFDYPPRQKFFRQQLKEYLLLAREENIDATVLTGSYAGAMGLPQFMPSSFRQYAVDFDGDGKKDIWNNTADAIGSVANYLAKHGWKKNELITRLATTSGSKYEDLLNKSLKPYTTIKELNSLGFKPTEAHSSLKEDTPATAMVLNGEKGKEYWLGLQNFYVITRYNHSRMYAMSVYQLSLEIQ